jgi:hypothetical protein
MRRQRTVITGTHKITVVVDTARRWEKGAKPGPQLCAAADDLMTVINHFLDTQCEIEPAPRVDHAALADAVFRKGII